MAGIPENKTRITITVGRGVLEKLDGYCEETGLTRSAAIGSIVAEHLSGRDRVMGMLGEMFSPEMLSSMLDTSDK